MADQPYMLNGKIIQVPEGHTPPSGAIALSGGQPATSGIDGNGFAAAAAIGGGGSTQTTIPVWRMTLKNRHPFGAAPDMVHDVAVTPKQMGNDEATLQFANILQDPNLFKSWAKIALDAGLINPDQMTDAVALGAAWKQAVGWAINFKDASNGTTDLTPFEAAKKVAENTGSALAAKQAYAAKHFTGDRVTTDDTVSDKPADEQTLHDLLGRTPTPGELAAYRHGVSTVAEANPTHTQTTTHYQDGTATSQQNVVTGGFDQRQAEIDASYSASPDVAANQQATTYYDALVQALRAAV